MAPWVSKVFMKILPKILCIERPAKEEQPEDEATEVLTDVFHVPSDIDKFTDYGSKRFSQDYGIAGEYFGQFFLVFDVLRNVAIIFSSCIMKFDCREMLKRWDHFPAARFVIPINLYMSFISPQFSFTSFTFRCGCFWWSWTVFW